MSHQIIQILVSTFDPPDSDSDSHFDMFEQVFSWLNYCSATFVAALEKENKLTCTTVAETIGGAEVELAGNNLHCSYCFANETAQAFEKGDELGSTGQDDEQVPLI